LDDARREAGQQPRPPAEGCGLIPNDGGFQAITLSTSDGNRTPLRCIEPSQQFAQMFIYVL
jgi:hypothetical protein